jgi:hypothetical protein
VLLCADADVQVEESGEHTILGTGEVYLDSLMKDLRELYAGKGVWLFVSYQSSPGATKSVSVGFPSHVEWAQ